jgi:WD40 repeat protein
MSIALRTAFTSGGAGLTPLYTHGSASASANAVLLPCDSGASLILSDRTRALPLPATDDTTSAIALSPLARLALVAGRSGFAVLTRLDARAPPRVFRPFDTGVVAHAVFDASGGLLALAPAAGFVRIYDSEAGHVTHAFALPRESALLSALAFHPDTAAMRLFVGTENGDMHCFDLSKRDKAPVYSVAHHVSAVVSFAFADAGRAVVAASRDRVLSVSDVSSGKSLRLMVTNEELVGIATIPARNDCTVVSAGTRGILRVWDVKDGIEVTALAMPVPLVTRYGDKADRLPKKDKSGDARDGGVDAESDDDGDKEEEGEVHNVVTGLVPCGDNRSMVTLSDRTVITICADETTGSLSADRAICGNLEQVNDLRVLPVLDISGNDADADDSVQLQQQRETPDMLIASNTNVLWVVQPPAGALMAKSSGAEGSLATSGGNGEAEAETADGSDGEDKEGNAYATGDSSLHHQHGWTCKDVLDGHRGIILSLDVASALNGSGKKVTGPGSGELYAASASRDKTARVWHRSAVGDWNCIGLAEGHTDAVTAVALSPKTLPDSFLMVTAANDRTLKLWKLRSALQHAAKSASATGKVTVRRSSFTKGDGLHLTATWTVLAHDMDINAAAVSPDGKMVATGSQDKCVKLWDVETGALKVLCRGHRRGVFDVCFSPVDRVVASSSGDATIRIWNAMTGACVRTLQGHDAGVLKSVFMTRGMQLASSGMDGLVKMWTVRTGECDETVDAHADAVWALDIANDGCAVVSGGMDGTVQVWCDGTELQASEAAARKDDEALVTQRIDDAARYHKWPVAVDSALHLNMPRKLKAVFAQLITTSDDVEGELAKVMAHVGSKSDASDKVGRLLLCVRDWNATGGASNAGVGVHVLQAVFRAWTPAALCDLIAADKRALVEALIAHTARHEARVAALVARAYFIDYSLEAMRALPELADERGGTTKGSLDVVRARKRVVEANARHQSQDAKRRKKGHGDHTAY